MSTSDNIVPFQIGKAVQTGDGFANFVQRSGLGTANTLSQGTYTLSDLLSRNRIKLEAMYRQSWVVGAMVDSVAEDMTKYGIDMSGDLEPSVFDDMQEAMEDLGVWDALTDTLKWSRLYGGAVGVMQIAGQNLATPLRIETIGQGQFQGLAVYDRWMLQPDLSRIIPSGPNIGLPEFYKVISSYDASTQDIQYGQSIHYTRCVRQIPIKLPMYQAVTEEYWGESVIERLFDRLLSFDTATMGAANLIDKAHLRHIGINGLREILAAGGPAEENLIKMFHYVRTMQTNEGITLLDKDDTWNTGTYTFAGLSDMLLQFGQQLAGATGIPLVRLFGMSPAGLNSTGESDLRTYYDGIGTKQEANLRRPLKVILSVIHRSLYGTDLPRGFKFKFNPLWQLSDKEKAETGEVVARTVISVVDAGLMSPAEGMKELKAASEETGMFGNISEESIAEAEALPPPAAPTQIDPVAPATPETQDVDKPTFASRFKSFLGLK